MHAYTKNNCESKRARTVGKMRINSCIFFAARLRVVKRIEFYCFTPALCTQFVVHRRKIVQCTALRVSFRNRIPNKSPNDWKFYDDKGTRISYVAYTNIADSSGYGKWSRFLPFARSFSRIDNSVKNKYTYNLYCTSFLDCTNWIKFDYNVRNTFGRWKI